MSLNVTVSKKDLLPLLARAESVAEKKSTMPALSMVLLEARDGLRVSATDLYLSLSTHVGAEVGKPGSFAVPAKDLFERVKMMPDGPIELTASNTLVVKAKGAARRFTLRGMPSDDFPPMPKPDPEAARITVDARVFVDLIARTRESISTDETRAHLNSALTEIDGSTVRMVSTDGHRLSKAERTFDGSASATWLIPLKAALELRQLLEGVEGPAAFTQSGSSLFVQVGETTFGVKLVDAQFPPYESVIPEGHPHTVRIARAPLADAIKAVSVAAKEKTGGIKFTFEGGKVLLTSESPESGEGVDEVPCEYDGPKIVVGFNGKYVLDALAAAQSDEVELTLNGELDPMLMRPVGDEGFVGVVMPMRV